MVSLFFSQNKGVFSPSTLLIVIFWVISYVPSLPMSVTTHSNCCLQTNYFAERSYCLHIPPLGSLLLESSSAVAMTPSMATDLAVTPHLYPLFLLLAAHPMTLEFKWDVTRKWSLADNKAGMFLYPPWWPTKNWTPPPIPSLIRHHL